MVLYTQNAELPADDWQVKSVAGPVTQTLLGNLTLNVTYHLRLQARNSIGYSPLTSSTVFYSKPVVSPGLIIHFPFASEFAYRLSQNKMPQHEKHDICVV